MTTTKKRLNISLSSPLESAVKKLAKRDGIPQATKITELLQIALEIEEDKIWGSLAKQRDKKGAKFISHNKAWE
ncbi:MAG: hypothetical protein ABII97_01765 [Patescibacteria group bacterium]